MNSGVRGFAARKTESGALGEEALPVTYRQCGDGVGEGIRRVSTCWKVKIGSNDRGATDKGGKDTALNAIETGSETKRVLAEGFGAVIFRLFVALKSLLGREEIRARAEGIYTRGEAVGVTTNFDSDAGRRIKNIAAENGIINAVAEFGVADAQAVSP